MIGHSILRIMILLLSNGSTQPLEVASRVILFSDEFLKMVPKMLYRIEIRDASCPLQGSDTDFIRVATGNIADLWSEIAVPKKICPINDVKGTTFSQFYTHLRRKPRPIWPQFRKNIFEQNGVEPLYVLQLGKNK